MDYDLLRLNMIDCQILPNRVTDQLVIDAMATLPRESFVPKKVQPLAYMDEAVPLGDGRFMMEPMVVARMLQAVEVQETDVVLDVGCGNGYNTAALAKIAATVFGVEPNAELVAKASETLNELGIDNAVVVEGDVDKGYASEGPYNVIFFSGAVSEIPQAVVDQLADGGRLIAIVTTEGNLGHATLVMRDGDVVSSRQVFDAGTPYLPGMEAKKRFVF